MRASTVATVLFLASGLGSAAFAQQQQPTSGGSQTQTTPVQPDRTPQQSDQAREQDRQSAEQTRVNRDWTAGQRGRDRPDRDDVRQQGMGGAMDGHADGRTVGRNWRMQQDDERTDRSSRYYEEERPHRRVKICFEYDNGDEFCRYRD